MKRQQSSKDLGNKYEVGRFSTRWCVLDLSDGSRHSTHADEFTAIVECAKANKRYRAKRGWS